MSYTINFDYEKPDPEKIAKVLYHELSSHDESQYSSIEEDFSLSFPSLNIKKMINNYKHGESHSMDLWCRCGIGKRFKHNGEFEWLAGADKECTCTIMVFPVPPDSAL